MYFKEKLPENQTVNSFIVLNTLKRLKKCECMNACVCILNSVLLPWDGLQFSPVSIKGSTAACVSVLIGNVVNANRGNLGSEFSSITITHSAVD